MGWAVAAAILDPRNQHRGRGGGAQQKAQLNHKRYDKLLSSWPLSPLSTWAEWCSISAEPTRWRPYSDPVEGIADTRANF